MVGVGSHFFYVNLFGSVACSIPLFTFILISKTSSKSQKANF